jgi:hypothetical protein
MEAMTAPRMYQGHALHSFNVSRIVAAFVFAAALAAGVFLSTLLPYLSNLPR